MPDTNIVNSVPRCPSTFKLQGHFRFLPEVNADAGHAHEVKYWPELPLPNAEGIILVSLRADFLSIFKDFNFSSQIACNLTPADVIMTSCFEAHLWYKDYAYANFECCAMNINGKSLAQQKRVQSLRALVPKRRITTPPKKILTKRKAFSHLWKSQKVGKGMRKEIKVGIVGAKQENGRSRGTNKG